ncbi:MAG: hypothetical protein ACLT09_14555 [Flavonifractor plautii]
MDREGLINLPGRPEEQAWLRERLGVMTVREEFAIEAALQRGAPADAKEMVNLLAGLDEYEVVGGIQSYKDLGLYYLEETNTRLLELREYINLDELGRQPAQICTPACSWEAAMWYTRSGSSQKYTTASSCRSRTTAGACG